MTRSSGCRPSRPGRAGGAAGWSLRKWPPGAGRKTPALVGLAFQAGLRRSEIAALRWADIQPSGIEGAVLVHVRDLEDRSGRRPDRYPHGEKRNRRRPGGDSAPAPATPEPVFGLTPGQINRRIQAAAAAAGIDGISAHSFRVGLASELTARGASTTETMLAGGWSTARMVAHYSAGATAERGAVAKYL